MTSVKRYGQFCALARALDEIGDRWTLLIVRELLDGPAGYGDLLGRLPGIATNLLAARLVRLQHDGLVRKHGPGRARYELTDRGHALRPLILEIIRWGAPLMGTGPADDIVDERWAALALQAMLTSLEITGPPLRLRVHSGPTDLDVVLDAGGRRVEPADTAATPDAEVTAALPDLLACASTGEVTPDVAVAGDPDVVARVLGRRAAPHPALALDARRP